MDDQNLIISHHGCLNYPIKSFSNVLIHNQLSTSNEIYYITYVFYKLIFKGKISLAVKSEKKIS